MKPKIYTSSSHDVLLDHFLKDLAQDENRSDNPFEAEKVLVQSFGMAKWLRLAIARHTGVCANIDFPFPVSFAREICLDIFGRDDLTKREEFRDSSMLWHIYQELPLCIKDDKKGIFTPLADYLKGALPGLRLYELSARIADVFDQYLFYRPDWINAWDSGKEVQTGGAMRDEKWQHALWLRICKSFRKTVDVQLMHPAGIFAGVEKEMQKLQERGVLATMLPSRVAVFGISYLPPVLSEFFLTFGSYTNVTFYLYSPAEDMFWGDVAHKRAPGLLLQEKALPVDLEHFPKTGHLLLDQCGSMGRQFLNTMLSAQECQHAMLAATEKNNVTLLDRLKLSVQSAVPNNDTFIVDANDVSFSIHSVHTHMREMEVIRDQILDAFNRDADLTPDQVLVLIPDVEKYTPYIDAVFGFKSHPNIPYMVADRVFQKQSPLAQGVLDLLALAEGRYTLSEMLGVLEYAALRRAFSIEEHELTEVATFLDEAQVRWGRNATDRERVGMPAFDNNSWQKGLDRLFLGHIFASDSMEVSGLQPLMCSSIDLVGRVATFFYTVTKKLDGLRDAKVTTGEWSQLLQSLIRSCFDLDDREVVELQEFHVIFEELEKVQHNEGITDTCGLDVIRAHLARNLNTCATAHGFIDGGVTFCSFKPMRSIPFRMLVMAGMELNEFPRKSSGVGFDLATNERRQGDRSNRDDDRYLFLEMLLATRNRLLITYRGRSAFDDSTLSPSVVVTELTDMLDTLCVPPRTSKAKTMEEYVTLQHHLIACHADYFNPDIPQYFSFNHHHLQLSKLLGRGRDDLDGVIARDGLVCNKKETYVLAPEKLVMFWKNPSRYYIYNCLGGALVKENGDIDDAESFDIDALARYSLAEEFVAILLEGKAIDVAKVQNTDRVPLGEFGCQVIGELVEKVTEFTTRIKKSIYSDELKYNIDMLIELPEGELFNIVGSLKYYKETGILWHRFASINERDKINAWIYHVLHNFAGSDLPKESRLTTIIGSKSELYLLPLDKDDAERYLKILLKWYVVGQKTPLAYTSKATCMYASSYKAGEHKGYTPEKTTLRAVRAAKGAWEDSYGGGPPESKDLYYSLCFMEKLPVASDDFEAIARDVWLPIIDSILTAAKFKKLRSMSRVRKDDKNGGRR